MQDIYLLVSGPLAWAAWIIFALGSVWKIWSTLSVAKQKDQGRRSALLLIADPTGALRFDALKID